MTISRGQMNRQLRMGGGIMDIVPRDKALLGGIKRAVKKVTGGVKDIVSSDIGKAALIGAAAFGIPGTSIGGIFGRSSFMVTAGGAPGIFGIGGVKNLFTANVAKDTVAKEAAKKIGLKETLGIMAGGSLLGTLAAGVEAGDQEAIEATRNVDALKTYLRQGYRNLKSFVKEDGSEDAEALEAQVNKDVSEYTAGAGGYAEGGRIGFADGPVLPPDPTQPVNPFGPKPGDFGIEEDIEIKMASDINNERILERLYEDFLDLGFSPEDAAKAARDAFDRMSKKIMEPTRGVAALGGRMSYALGDTASENAMQAAGIEGLPVRQNPKGVKELDLRETGGFIPPVGIKEKEDDIPAMLSNNEFVFTADAVRGMGEGDVNKGAERMYNMMKTLEAGGRV